MIQQYYVKEKVDAGHSLGLRVKDWDGWFKYRRMYDC